MVGFFLPAGLRHATSPVLAFSAGRISRDLALEKAAGVFEKNESGCHGREAQEPSDFDQAVEKTRKLPEGKKWQG